jgi:hypothetical protein
LTVQGSVDQFGQIGRLGVMTVCSLLLTDISFFNFPMLTPINLPMPNVMAAASKPNSTCLDPLNQMQFKGKPYIQFT